MGPQPRLASLHSMNERHASRDWMKRVNRNLVLNLVKSAGPISRKEIADRSGLSPATITNLTAELIAEDLVHEIGSGEAPRGRPPVLLRLNTTAATAASAVARWAVRGLGLGLAGLIDGRAGVCRYSPFFGWRDVDLVGPLHQALDLDVFVENDRHAPPIAEQGF